MIFKDSQIFAMEEVLVVISCFVNIILWIFFFFYFKKKFSSEQILEDIRQEFEKLLTDIQGQTDRDLTLIEAKMNELKEVVEKADQQIKLAKREQRRQRKEEAEQGKKPVPVSIPEVIPPVEPVVQNPVYPVENVISRYTEKYDTVNKTAEEQSVLIIPKTSVQKNDKPMRERVLELWKLGMEPEVIAEKLTVSLAEISMIIDMYG